MKSTNLHPQYKGVVLTLLAVCFLAGNGYFAKGLETNTLSITLIRSFIAAALIGLITWARRKPLTLFNSRDYGLSCLAGVLLGIHWICFFYSMYISSVTLGMTMLYTYPMMTLVIQAMFMSQRPPKASWIMAPLALAGIVVMAQPESASAEHNMEGIILGLISALCFAGRNLLQQRYLAAYPPHISVFYQTLVICALIMVLNLFLPSPQVSFENAEHEWFLWLILGGLFTALPHSMIASAINHIGARTVAIIGCVQPVIASLFAYHLLGEVASVSVIVGAVIILCAAAGEVYFSLPKKPERTLISQAQKV